MKASEWLRRTNRERADDAHVVLGRLLEEFMDEVVNARTFSWSGKSAGELLAERQAARERIREALAQAGMTYSTGGIILAPNASTASKQLASMVRRGDLAALNAEFDRASQDATNKPRDSLSFAANTLEAVLGDMIEVMDLPPPNDRTLRRLWHTVRVPLGIDPKGIDDPEVRQIATAMGALVESLASLRDDKSAAHALKPDVARNYRIEPRHARLAINAAHTLAVFLLETLLAKPHLKKAPGP